MAFEKNQQKNYDDLIKQIENEETTDVENYPVPEEDLLNDSTMEQIMKAKNANKSAFESYWETDENDIDAWTNVIFLLLLLLFLLILL